MAPIVFAVRSAAMHAAPSRNKRASSAANNPSVVIGITVSITGFVLAIGTLCWLLIRRRARTLKAKNLQPSEYRRISELSGPDAVPPEYFEPLQSTSFRGTPSESEPAAGSHSSEEKVCGTPQQIYNYSQRPPQELPGMYEYGYLGAPIDNV
jgi:hypothetical protein